MGQEILGIQVPEAELLLPDMLEKQIVLIKYYQQIEGLPEYPLDLQSKSGQKIFKSFVQRFTEELAESFEYLESANSAVNTNNLLNAQQAIQGYNHEIADAIHFLWEILIYVGIDSHKLDGYIGEFVNGNNGLMSLYKQGSPLESLLIIAGVTNFNLGITKERMGPSHFSIYTLAEIGDNPQCAGGRRLSDSLLDEHKKALWDVVYLFNITANHLKNKEWANTEREINYSQFYYNLFQAILQFFVYLELSGFTPRSIYINYCLNNQKNLSRISGGY